MNLEIIHVGLLGTNCYVSWDEDKNCVVVDCGGDADKVADLFGKRTDSDPSAPDTRSWGSYGRSS